MTILEKIQAGVVTGSADETRSLAGELAGALPHDTALALHGDLGAGKTTFVQGLACGLGVTEAVTSPTFAIFTLHRAPRLAGQKGINLIHLDAYRLDDPRQIDALMLEEFLLSPWYLAVEWPDKIGAWLPKNALHLDLSIASDGRHSIRLR